MSNSAQYDDIFKNFYITLKKTRNLDAKSEESIAWLRNVVRNVANINKYGTVASPTKIMKSDAAKLKPANQIVIGQLLFYFYDPKYKVELPFYDNFPLVFPFAMREDGKGFFGINLHYLHPAQRMKLLSALLEYKKGHGMRGRLDWDYSVLKAIATHEETRHCVKNYLFSQFKSPLFQVLPADWPIATMLPVERFQKVSKQQVWSMV